MERENHKHESFGQISFSRISGRTNFYGSELEQDHYIDMEVYASEVERDLTQDWYYARGLPLIKVRMSSGQFSELITNLNIGTGTTCTIEMVNEKYVQELPFQESRKEFVHRKFEDRMKEFAIELRKRQKVAKTIIAKKTLSKDDMRTLQQHVDWLTQEVESNIPFFAKCFQETMDEVIQEAKLEVENAIQHKISVLGLTELHKQNNMLKEK